MKTVFGRMWLILAFVLAGCAALGLGPAEHADIADTASKIAECEAAGYACKADAGPDAGCYRTAYEPCMREAGLM